MAQTRTAKKAAVTRAEKVKQRAGLFARAVALAVLGLTFFMAQSAFWINHALFNQENFTQTASEVLLSDTSRDAIAQTIVDNTLADRPLVKRVIGDQATSFVSSILGSNLSENAVSGLISRSYAYLTSPNREAIAIDLTSIKQPIAGILSFVENQGRQVQFNADAIPDAIVILEADALPDFSGVVRSMLIFGLVFWLITIIGGLVFVFYKRRDWRRRAYQLLAVWAGTSIVALFIGPFIPQIIASFMGVISLRGVVSDMTGAFLSPFGMQMIWSAVICGVLFLVVYFWWVFPKAWGAIVAAVQKRSGTTRR